jgi:hypothetical protein
VLPTKFQLIWPHGFRKDFLKLAISHTRTAYDGYISCILAELKKIFSYETRRHNELLLCRNGVFEILYKISIFHADHTTNIAIIGSSCVKFCAIWSSGFRGEDF